MSVLTDHDGDPVSAELGVFCWLKPQPMYKHQLCLQFVQAATMLSNGTTHAMMGLRMLNAYVLSTLTSHVSSGQAAPRLARQDGAGQITGSPAWQAFVGCSAFAFQVRLTFCSLCAFVRHHLYGCDLHGGHDRTTGMLSGCVKTSCTCNSTCMLHHRVQPAT